MDDVAARLQTWLAGRNPLWGLDFDGTLVPLDKDPERVKLSTRALGMLERLATGHDVAIISGRALGDLRRHVPVPRLHYIGNHGAQTLSRSGALWEWHSPEWVDWRHRRMKELVTLTQAHGGRIEDKNITLTVHFRGADEDWWWASGGAELKKILAPEGEIMGGTLCWNVTPRGAPHKGVATQKLVRDSGHDSLIYFGDEPTDENVFRLGWPELFGVKVGEGPTAAQARLSGPQQVLEVLTRFV
jgi:trehalose-phosphatase